MHPKNKVIQLVMVMNQDTPENAELQELFPDMDYEMIEQASAQNPASELSLGIPHRSISRKEVLEFVERATHYHLVASFEPLHTRTEWLHCMTQSGQLRISPQELLYGAKQKGGTKLAVKGGKIFSSTPFTELFAQLKPWGWIAINKQYIINPQQIKDYNEKERLTMSNGKRLKVRKVYRGTLLDQLSKLKK